MKMYNGLKYLLSGFCIINLFLILNPAIARGQIKERNILANDEFIQVTDPTLKRYWPKGVTRVVLQFINPSLKGGQSVTFTKI